MVDDADNSQAQYVERIDGLHRTDAYTWTKPVDAEEALRVNVRRLLNDKEFSQLKDGVKVWTRDELATLFGYATDQDRLLTLLGLNCGFAQSEICSLCDNEIVGDASVRTIKRIRRKSTVYGEFALWPYTMAALAWFAKQRPRAEPKSALTLLTQEGNPFDRQRIANSWNDLFIRIHLDFLDFRRLSFEYLRKTAGQLVRERSDGEIMGVFM